MKFLFPLLVLSTLTACSGGNGNGSGGKLNKFANAIKTIDRGTVIVERVAGNFVILSQDNNAVKVTDDTEGSVNTSIVLKMEGKKVYKLSKQVTPSSTFEFIQISDAPEKSEFDQLLSLPGSTIEGDVLTYGYAFTESYESMENIMVTSKRVVNGQILLSNPHCSSVSSISETEASYVYNGVTGAMPDSKIMVETTCLAKLSVEALKALDLRSVSVCDGTTTDEEYTCLENQNMMHLTSDL